jgi:hypothetical protein
MNIFDNNNTEIALPVHKWASKLDIRVATVHILIKNGRLTKVGTDSKGRAIYAKTNQNAFTPTTGLNDEQTTI